MNRHVSHHGVFINFCGHPTSKYESNGSKLVPRPLNTTQGAWNMSDTDNTHAVNARHGQKHTSAMRRHEPAMLAMDTYLIEYWSSNRKGGMFP